MNVQDWTEKADVFRDRISLPSVETCNFSVGTVRTLRGKSRRSTLRSPFGSALVPRSGENFNSSPPTNRSCCEHYDILLWPGVTPTKGTNHQVQSRSRAINAPLQLRPPWLSKCCCIRCSIYSRERECR